MGREEKGESDIRATGAARSQEKLKKRVQRGSQSQEQLQRSKESQEEDSELLSFWSEVLGNNERIICCCVTGEL